MSLVILPRVQSATGWHAQYVVQLAAVFVSSVAQFESVEVLAKKMLLEL